MDREKRTQRPPTRVTPAPAGSLGLRRSPWQALERWGTGSCPLVVWPSPFELPGPQPGCFGSNLHLRRKVFRHPDAHLRPRTSRQICKRTSSAGVAGGDAHHSCPSLPANRGKVLYIYLPIDRERRIEQHAIVRRIHVRGQPTACEFPCLPDEALFALVLNRFVGLRPLHLGNREGRTRCRRDSAECNEHRPVIACPRRKLEEALFRRQALAGTKAKVLPGLRERQAPPR